MGYLDSDTTSVDAILTKHGRKKLADGHDLGIRHFALADDGVDYTLYNNGHISGSNYYGADITGMPLPEAVPEDTVAMKYFLVTRARNTVYQPKVTAASMGSFDIIIEDQGEVYAKNMMFETLNGKKENYDITVLDTSIATFTGASMKNISGAQGDHLAQQYISKPGVFRVSGDGGLKIIARPTSKQRTTAYKVTGVDSGTTAYGTITIEENIKNTFTAKANAGTT